MFKPSARLSGGLLWKIPWRLSSHQKLRQRQRLRRVDNVVSILDAALQRQGLSASIASRSIPSATTASPANEDPISTQADTTNLSSSTGPDLTTSAAVSQSTSPSNLSEKRHGRGPRAGDMLPTHDTHGVTEPHSSITLSQAAQASSTIRLITRWKAEMPAEAEMLPRDKYSIFDKKVRGFRKSVRKLPKWTRVSQRVNPPGF